MATLTTLVGNIQSSLTASLFTDSTCFYAFDPKRSKSYPPSDQFCVIQPNSLKVKDRTFRQSNRTNMLITFSLTLWLYSRLALDEYNRSDTYLFDTNLGSLPLTDSILDALQTYSFNDGANLITYELDDISWQNEERDGVGWAITKLTYHTDLAAAS